MMAESGVVYRRARSEDYEGVLNIGEFFEGVDYVPYFFHKYFKDPMVYSYVCEKDGEIVSHIVLNLSNNLRVQQYYI